MEAGYAQQEAQGFRSSCNRLCYPLSCGHDLVGYEVEYTGAGHALLSRSNSHLLKANVILAWAIQTGISSATYYTVSTEDDSGPAQYGHCQASKFVDPVHILLSTSARSVLLQMPRDNPPAPTPYGNSAGLRLTAH